MRQTKPFDINNARTWDEKSKHNFGEFLRIGVRSHANRLTGLSQKGFIEKIENQWRPRKDALAAWKAYLGK